MDVINSALSCIMYMYSVCCLEQTRFAAFLAYVDNVSMWRLLCLQTLSGVYVHVHCMWLLFVVLLADTGSAAVAAVPERGAESPPVGVHGALQQDVVLVQHHDPQPGGRARAREDSRQVPQSHEGQSTWMSYSYACASMISVWCSLVRASFVVCTHKEKQAM